ncbi:MAG: inositol monophosphatase [Marinilabiliaceae bacterium]|nr:inositol monophosphatase [Marinilabiliaceae bacterium]
MTLQLKELCDKVVDLARKTGQIIKNERNNSTLNIESKGKNDFVTHIDKLSEKLIIEGLQSFLPQSGFIAEENTKSNKGEIFNWIIDPIDGTTNFIHGLSPHAISIALMQNDEIVIGVIYELGLDECFYSYKGGNAFLNGKKISVSTNKTIADSLIATGFPYTQYERIKPFMKTLEHFMHKSHGIRRLGSAATDLAYVACGRFDGFYEYNLNAWDVAAGAFLVQQAGGKVSDFYGSNNYIFGKELVASNTIVFDEFLSDINKIMCES